MDRDYVLNTAKLAKSRGCKHFSIVTGWKTNKDSSFLILKTKVSLKFDEISFIAYYRGEYNISAVTRNTMWNMVDGTMYSGL